MGSGSFTLGKEQRCLLNGGLVEPQSGTGCYGDENNFLNFVEIEPRTYCTYVKITDYFAVMVCVSETDHDGHRIVI